MTSPASMSFARQQRFALDRADGKAGEIVVARRIDPRHLGGLAADQRAARLLAAFGDAADHRLGHAEIELAGGEIVEKEQRLGALHDDVVDVHGDEVDADAVMNAGLDGELELGADAVGGGDQHRVLEAASLEVEQAAEAADAAEHALRVWSSPRAARSPRPARCLRRYRRPRRDRSV